MFYYDSLGPNPRALRMYLIEKKLELESKSVDMMGAENRKPPYTEKNPGGQIPALELDDGAVLGETVAIFEYLDEKHPEPPLVGKTAEERAATRMWVRRVEQRITENLYNGFRFSEGLPMFKDRTHCLPEAAAGLKAIAQENLAWLDGLLGDGPFVVGDRFTIVDIALYCALDFGAGIGQTVDPSLKNVHAWLSRVGSRPSAASSLHPASAKSGIRG